MPLCGFNEKMLEGLVAFHEGLVEHGLIERAKIREQSVNETLERELADIGRFLAETRGMTDSEVREVTETLTDYARAFYRLIQKRGVNNYQQTISALNKFYVGMDRKFYEDLEGKPEDMRQLVGYLNEVGV